ncbi:hypothetical protein EV361DRAFT_805293 [Lentinula raphanica]|nr:hypothetical protein EV361DRAFT_805293 [Lentinula raphanica]
MRMSGEGESDRKYRIALENMRYKSCTKSDIQFLNSLISSNLPGHPSAKFSPWRNAPIIVGENKYKDEINRLGTLRFASETKQKLLRFFSDDIVTSSSPSIKFAKNKKSTINAISEELQKVLWDLPTSAYDLNCPGVLDICLGLPVVIRHNVATELSITKGQKGSIYAWHIGHGTFGQNVLETIFVLLHEPPKDIQIGELPLNVVPISRRKTSGSITLPDDTKITITRNQVDILPGFAMTAHASQGQSLDSNAVDLNTLTDHHAWYTALSRSRSAAKTLILQGFDSSKIVGGASGALRREYRELELLDEITLLRFQNKLPTTVCGSTRKLLIETFLNWKGLQHNPPHLHPSIQWTKENPYIIEHDPLLPWTMVDKKKFQDLIQSTSSHKISTTHSSSTSSSSRNTSLITSYFKSNKVSNPSRPATSSFTEVVALPLTTVWSNNSCAFDSIFPILYQVWLESNALEYDCYSVMPGVIEDFEKVKANLITLNEARDTYRHSLAVRSPRHFAFGRYCAVTEVLEDILRTNVPFIKCTLWCESNHRPRRQPQSVKHCNVPEIRDIPPASTAQWLHENSAATSSTVCHICSGTLIKQYHIQFAPPFIVFPCDGTPDMQICETIYMTLPADNSVSYSLKGIIYYSSIRQHFISRIISSQGFIYQHDGLSNGGEPVLECTSLYNVNLNLCQSARLTCVIYKRS